MPYPDEPSDLRDDLVSGPISAGGTPLDDGTGHADLHNDTSAAVNAVEATLGLNPEGAHATVVERLNSLGWGILGYVETTSNQAGISSVTNVTGLELTVGVGANRRLRVTGHVRIFQRTSAGVTVGFINTDTPSNNTTLNLWVNETLGVDQRTLGEASAIVQDTGAGGSMTFRLRLQTSAGTVDTTAAATTPGFLLVEDIGAA